MRTYRCTQTIIMDDGTTEAFTTGQLYHGQTSATPSGEWAMCFTNNQKEDHLIPADWLHKHFTLIEEQPWPIEEFEDEPADSLDIDDYFDFERA